MRIRVGCLAFVAACLACLAGAAEADELSELKAQMQAIQQENEALQEQLNRQRELTAHLMNKIAVLETKDQRLSRDVEQLMANGTPAGPFAAVERPFGPALALKGFADVSFKAEDDLNAGEQNPNSFALGQLDLFMTSELSDRINVLAETVFEFNEDNEAALDVERLELKYAFSDLVNIRVGRMQYADRVLEYGVPSQRVAAYDGVQAADSQLGRRERASSESRGGTGRIWEEGPWARGC